MKTKNSTQFLAVLSIISLIGTGCAKEGCTDPKAVNYNTEAEKDDGSCTYIFQGPLNASFEDPIDFFYGGGYWLAGEYDDSYNRWIEVKTNLDFMPTNGQKYLSMSSKNFRGDDTPNRVELVYQDNINLSYSTKLIFDYELIGHGQAKIFFTSNGTETLWTSDTTKSLVQIKNE